MPMIIHSSEDEDDCCITECDSVGDFGEIRHEVIQVFLVEYDRKDDNGSESDIISKSCLRPSTCRKDTRSVKDPFGDIETNLIGVDSGVNSAWLGSQLSVAQIVSESTCGNVRTEQSGNIRDYIQEPVEPTAEIKGNHELKLNELEMEVNYLKEEWAKSAIMKKQQDIFLKTKRSLPAKGVGEDSIERNPSNKSSEEHHISSTVYNLNSVEHTLKRSKLSQNKNNTIENRSIDKPKISTHVLPSDDEVETKSMQTVPIKRIAERERDELKKYKPIAEGNVKTQLSSRSLNKVGITKDTTNRSDERSLNSTFKSNEIIEDTNHVENNLRYNTNYQKRRIQEQEHHTNKTLLQNISHSPKSETYVQKENIKLTPDSSTPQNKNMLKLRQDLFSDMQKNLTNKNSTSFNTINYPNTSHESETVSKTYAYLNQPLYCEGNNKPECTINKCNYTESFKVVIPAQKSSNERMTQHTCGVFSSNTPQKSNTDVQEEGTFITSIESETTNGVKEIISILTLKLSKEILETMQDSTTISAPNPTQTLLLESLTKLSTEDLLRLKSCFVTQYRLVFNDSVESTCTKMGDLLYLALAAARNLNLRVDLANKLTIDHLKYTEIMAANISYRESLLDYKRAFYKLFDDIYRPISSISNTSKKQITLYVAWFLKLFIRVVLLSPEFFDSLREAQVNVVALLSLVSREILGKSGVVVLLCNEQIFTQYCWIILDFMQASLNVNYKPDQKEERFTDRTSSTETIENNNALESSNGHNFFFNNPYTKSYLKREEYLREENTEMNDEILQNQTTVALPIGSNVDKRLPNKLLVSKTLNTSGSIVNDCSKNDAAVVSSSDSVETRITNFEVSTNTQNVINGVNGCEEEGSNGVKSIIFAESSVNTQSLSGTTPTICNNFGGEIRGGLSTNSIRNRVRKFNNQSPSHPLNNGNDEILSRNHSCDDLSSKFRMTEESFSVKREKRKRTRSPEFKQNMNNYNPQQFPDSGDQNPIPSPNCPYSGSYQLPLPPYNTIRMNTNTQAMYPWSYVDQYNRNEQLKNLNSSHHIQTNHGNTCRTKEIVRNDDPAPSYTNFPQINPSPYLYYHANYSKHYVPNSEELLPSMFRYHSPQQQNIRLYPNIDKERLIDTDIFPINSYDNKENFEPNKPLDFLYSSNLTTAKLSHVEYSIHNTGSETGNYFNFNLPTIHPYFQNNAGVKIDNLQTTNLLPSTSPNDCKSMNSNQYHNQ